MQRKWSGDCSRGMWASGWDVGRRPIQSTSHAIGPMGPLDPLPVLEWAHDRAHPTSPSATRRDLVTIPVPRRSIHSPLFAAFLVRWWPLHCSRARFVFGTLEIEHQKKCLFIRSLEIIITSSKTYWWYCVCTRLLWSSSWEVHVIIRKKRENQSYF